MVQSPGGGNTNIDAQDKSFPPKLWGSSVDEVGAAALQLSAFQTPVLALDRRALQHNTRAMFDWIAGNGLQIAPHGKTTMAPKLWRQLVDAGAWGMTFATGWQVQCARSFGIDRIMLANALVDPVAIDWISAELDAHPEFEFCCWVDSIDTVERMVAALHGGQRRIPVIIELGATGGRTGARTVDEAVLIADAVRDSGVLEVAGVGGYEGALAHDRSPHGVARVDAYLDEIAQLHARLAGSGHYEDRMPVVTAGGSAYFDRVAERLGALSGEAEVVLRSGAFQIHDDGFYAGITPMGTLVGDTQFRSAMHAWVRVVSRPEPRLALFDAGKRDLPYDEGMPVPQRVVGLDAEHSGAVLAGSEVTALNDQHGFLRLADTLSDAEAGHALPVGSVIRLGLSHPCTALDKWRLIPVIDDASVEDPVVVDAVETYF
jgi:D-serine deaminase-like pyridoxal phosphate-dependent protein